MTRRADWSSIAGRGVELYERHMVPGSGALVLEPLRLSDRGELEAALAAAGLPAARVRRVEKATHIVPPDAFLAYFLPTRPAPTSAATRGREGA
jgi:hypothetical protein